MKRLGQILLAALVAFPSFTVAVYGPCCTAPGGCQSKIPGPRPPCCEEKGACCTPRLFSVQNQIDAAVSVAAFAYDPGLSEAPAASEPAGPSQPRPLTVQRDPSHVPRGPTPLFIANCSLLR